MNSVDRDFHVALSVQKRGVMAVALHLHRAMNTVNESLSHNIRRKFGKISKSANWKLKLQVSINSESHQKAVAKQGSRNYFGQWKIDSAQLSIPTRAACVKQLSISFIC